MTATLISGILGYAIKCVDINLGQEIKCRTKGHEAKNPSLIAVGRFNVILGVI
jgi:hypothetical protein